MAGSGPGEGANRCVGERARPWYEPRPRWEVRDRGKMGFGEKREATPRGETEAQRAQTLPLSNHSGTIIAAFLFFENKDIK